MVVEFFMVGPFVVMGYSESKWDRPSASNRSRVLLWIGIEIKMPMMPMVIPAAVAIKISIVGPFGLVVL